MGSHETRVRGPVKIVIDRPATARYEVAPSDPVRQPVAVAGLLVGQPDRHTGCAAQPSAGTTTLNRLRRADCSAIREAGAGQRATVPVRRYFAPPPLAYVQSPSPLGYSIVAQVTKSGGQQPGQPLIKQGWSIDKETVPATEIDNAGVQFQGRKTTRLTALMTPGHARFLAGNPTAQGYDPIGWNWITANEVRSARRGRISHWVRFHLLNATFGGKGRKILHLIPADQSANAKWRTGVEAAMKQWIGTAPVWYDVQVTYYHQNEAPGAYQPNGPNGIDYRPNITLFPKVIHAEWKKYDAQKAQWQDMPSHTVQSGFPAAPGQREAELVGAQNLSALASTFQINIDILSRLSTATKAFQSYAGVRRNLERWAADSTTTSQYVARVDRIASSEPYLRSALTGTGNRKLKIHNAFVPDDQTPEARFYVSPAEVKTGPDFWIFDSASQAIKSGYHHARQDAGDVPSARLFFHHYVKNGPVGNVTLAQLQTDWDGFVAANEALPPLVHTDFAQEGLEIQTLVAENFTEMVPVALHAQYQNLLGACQGVDSLRDHVAGHIPQFVHANLGTLRFTVYGSVPESVQAVKADPVVLGWIKEMDYRVEWFKHLTSKGLSQQCPHDFLNAAITDRNTVALAETWYEQYKQEQQQQKKNKGGAIYSSHSQRTGQTGHSGFPWGAGTDPKNQTVIRHIEARCESERSRGTTIDQQRIDNVLKEWRKPTYVGKGDTTADVEKAVKYILRL